ncbi:MAG: hypothetical protein K9W44_18030 [Candidatus Lokiarchaeota archaeon]|nr:hypothetical protein [Candidatus Harpocratesius repetitus]
MDTETQQKLKSDYYELLQYFEEQQAISNLSQINLKCSKQEGEKIVLAYPIQGLLKYHGMTDPLERIAYFSSISLNNGVGATITYVHLSRQREKDILILNGTKIDVSSRIYKRVLQQLNLIRAMTQLSSKALIISRNVYFSDNNPNTFRTIKEKGLGTSASAGAAIATAIMHIIYPNRSEILNNPQIRSIFARFLAGSASRSATGGISLWLSHPSAKSLESFSLRLDQLEDRNFLNEIVLFTIPLISELKTEHAHTSAPNSPYFQKWALQRKDKIIQFIEAIKTHDFKRLGELAEEDTLALHAISMTTGINDYILAWKSETLLIMKLIQRMRKEKKIPIYYSIDTGPTVVIITLKSFKDFVFTELKKHFPKVPILISKIQGAPKIIEPDSHEYSLIREDLLKFRHFR